MPADRSVTYRIRADITQLRAQVAAASASVGDLGNKMTAADKDGQRFRRGLDTVGTSARNIGAVAAVGLGAAVLKAANFDQAMSNVQAATHETADNMEQLRAAALKAGADTAFSATEAAAGITELSKAGVSTEDVLAGGLRGALDLAAAGNQSVGEAAETAATAMTQFGLSGEQIPHIADLLAAGAGKAQGEVSDLAAALNQGGLVAAQMGLSIEDTTGVLAAFASAGLVGSDAGTSFKSMIQRLQNPIGQGAEAIAELGLQVYDAQGNFVGITNVAGQLQDKLGGLTQAQRDAALAQIFGSDAVRGATVLYEQGAKGIGDWISKTNDAGYATETAALKLDNLKGDLEKLGGALETALIGTGSGSDGALRSLTQSVTGLVDSYNDLPPATQSSAGALLAVTAAAGGGVFVFSKVVQGVADTREALSSLGVSADGTKGKLATFTRVAGAASLALGALAISDVYQSQFDRAAPGIQATTEALLGLRDTRDLPKDLDGLAESIDRLTNRNPFVEFQDNASDFLGGIGGGRELRESRAQIEALDAALSGLVASAGPEEAADAFDDLADSAGLSKSEIGDLKSVLPSFKEALTGARNEAKLAAGEADFFSTSMQALSQMATNASMAVLTGTDAFGLSAEQLEELNTAALETSSAFTGLGKGLNDANLSLGDYTKQLADQAAALEEFTVNAETAANRGLRDGLIAQLRAAGPEGALRLRQLANATDEEIAAMNAAFDRGEDANQAYADSLKGINAAVRALPEDAVTEIRTEGLPKTRADIVDLAAKYNLTPRDVRTLIRETGARPTREAVQSVIREAEILNGKRPKPVVSVGGIGGALAAAAALGRALDQAARDRTATIRIETRRDNASAANAASAGVGGGADGGRVVAMAGGGTVPGQRYPYGDKLYIFAAPGEEVISNRYGQADRFRADRAAGRIPAYADGGTVGATTASNAARTYGNGSTVIVFPTPAVSGAVLADAQGIAVAAALNARSSRDTEKAGLGILQQQQRINQLQKSLDEKEDVKVGKRGKGKKDKRKTIKVDALQGIDRIVAAAELEEARRELQDLNSRRDEVDAELQRFTEERDSAVESLSGQLDIFARGNSTRGALTEINRFTADVSAYGQVMAQLQGKASPALLQQIKRKADSGDFRSAVKMGRALLAQPAALTSLNSALSMADQAASATGQLLTDPRFFSGAAWAGAQQVAPQEINFNLGADPSTWMTQLMVRVEDVVDRKLAPLGG